jgi:DNA-binding NtrC family response regulator
MTEPTARTQKHKLEILANNNDKKDCASLRSIMAHTNWIFHCVPDLSKAIQFFEKNPVPVIVCSNEFPGGTWKAVLAAVRRFPNPPDVLVYTAQADDRLWMEVLSSGSYDLLPVPFNRDEVLRLISLASRERWDDANAFQGHVAAGQLLAAGDQEDSIICLH